MILFHKDKVFHHRLPRIVSFLFSSSYLVLLVIYRRERAILSNRNLKKTYICRYINNVNTLKKTGTEAEAEICEAKCFGAYPLSVSSVYDDGETYPFGLSVKHTVKADKFSIVEALKTIPAEGKVVYEYTFTNKK